jgi:replicative DNA helicase
MTIEVTPPHNTEAEEAVIGSVLISPEAYRLANVSAQDFYHHKHRFIWEAFDNLAGREMPIDFLTASSELDDMGYLEEIGGPAYLTMLINRTPSPLRVGAYGKLVSEEAEKREQLLVLQNGAKQIHNDKLDVGGIIRELIDNVRVYNGSKRIGEIIGDAEKYLRALQADKGCIPSPWQKFDDIAGGIYKKQSTLIAGAPGLGKTVFVTKYGLNAAMNGFQVDIYELEMPEEALILRWVSDLSGVTTNSIKNKEYTPEERNRVLKWFEYIKGLNIRISDSTHWNSTSIAADLLKKSYDNPSDLVIVDSIGQLRENDEKKWDRVETALLNLRQLAKEYNFALLSVATLVKDGSIRGTKEVEHITDYWYSFERPEEAKKPTHVEWWTREMYPGKQRHGGTAQFCPLKMDPNLPRLYVMGEVYNPVPPSIDERFHEQ